MEFPQSVMSATEIEKQCGIKKSILYEIAHTQGQKCAFKKSGGRKLWFITNKLSKELEKRMAR